MVYTIFTCMSVLFLESQHLGPFRNDFTAKLMTNICYFNVGMAIWSYIQTFRIRNTVNKMDKMMKVPTMSG